jgi:hypothetical protein
VIPKCPKCGGRDDTACYIEGKGRETDCPMWPITWVNGKKTYAYQTKEAS